MALGFFRRWQKGIIIVLVALMLIGLVGGTALTYLTRYTGGGDFARGESKLGPLHHSAVVQAENDLRNLAVFLRLDVRSREFMELDANSDEGAVAYALLVQEAAADGHEISQAEVDSYLKSIGLDVEQAEYRKIVNRVDRRKSGTTEPKLRAALARWLTVLRSFRAYQVTAPPSETVLKRRFRDLNEKVTLRIAKVPAEKFVSDILEPVESQISKQFNQYRTARPETYPTAESFGFGYAQPTRAAVEYMLINAGVIARVSRPSDKKVREHFRENAADFTKEVPIENQPATQPGATTKPDVVTKTVPMDMDEAWSQVVDRLSGWAAESKTEEFLTLVESLVDAQLGPASADAELYEHVREKLIDDTQAGDALTRMIKARDILALRGQTLDKAIPALARAAGLEAICYPWDAKGEFSVSRDVRIPAALQADGDRTLAIVLQELTRLVFTTGKQDLEAIPTGDSATTKPKPPQYPKLTWTTCRGFPKVLFPVSDDEGMTLLPVRVGRTKLLDARELSEHKDLATAQSSRRGRGKSLAAQAIGAKPLARGQVMYAFDDGGLNRILWQVVELKPAEILTEMTDAVRKDVIADYKTLQSFKTSASRAADKLAARARAVGLEAAAREADIETISSEPIARLTSQSQRDIIRQAVMRQAFMSGMPQGVSIQDYMAQVQAYADRLAVGYRPRDYMPSMIEGVDLKTRQAAERFLKRVFDAVVPVDIDKPLPAGKVGPVAAIPMPTARTHYVVERIGYAPAVVGDFVSTERAKLADEAIANSQWDALKGFFSSAGIIQRMSYEAGAKPKPEESDKESAVKSSQK